MTFEALRIQKADDFPELEDASAVTWQVRYGEDVYKRQPNPPIRDWIPGSSGISPSA